MTEMLPELAEGWGLVFPLLRGNASLPALTHRKLLSLQWTKQVATLSGSAFEVQMLLGHVHLSVWSCVQKADSFSVSATWHDVFSRQPQHYDQAML